MNYYFFFKLKVFRNVALAFAVSQILVTGSAMAQYWSNLGGGLGGWVYSSTVYNGNLVVGGSFTSAGGYSVRNIAQWDGSSWGSIGTGVNGQVDALTVYNGKLIAGGKFFEAGGVEVRYLAQWDGTEWTDVNGDMGSYVVSLVVFQNKLIIGGYFRDADGFPANYIVGYDEQWFSLGSGMGGSQGQVMALSVHNNKLYAGGFFTSAGGIPANHIAEWNGTSWSALGSGISNIVYSLTSYNGDLIAGGLFLSAGGNPANHIAKWNGSSWSALGSGMAGPFYQYVMALTNYGGRLIAGGLFESAGGVQAKGIAQWNGTSWSGVGGGFYNGGSNVCGAFTLCNYQTGIVAGGIFQQAGSIGAGNLAYYDEPPPGTVNITVTNEGFYDENTNKTRRKDLFTAYLCDSYFPFYVVDSSQAVIDSVTLSGSFTFNNVPSGQHYLVVKHRNSIETWSKDPVNYIAGGTLNYNFTTALTQAYGDNMKQVDFSPVRYAIYSGDVNQDGTVDVSDLLDIDNDVAVYAIGNLVTDLNADEIVDLTDIVIADNNAANFVGAITP